jgi:hypothetical protein
MAELSPEEALEVEADRNRRVTSAFRLGSPATSRTAGPSSTGQLAAGIAMAIAIALIIGVIALAQGAGAGGGASRSPAVVTPSK